MLTGKTDTRVQHGFGGMQNGSKKEHGMRDARNSNGRMRDKNISTRAGFAHFDRRDGEKQKIKRYGRYA